MANDTDRSTLFTTRSTESALTSPHALAGGTMTFFYHFFQGKGAWYTALVPAVVAVWEKVPHVFSLTTMLTIFKEGVDVMFTRLQEYRDRRKDKIAKEVEKQVAQQVEKIEKAAYQKGYEAAKAESRSNGK